MSVSAPFGQPSIGETLRSSFRDAAAAAKTNLVPAGAFVVLGTALAVTAALSGGLKAGEVPAWFPIVVTVADIAGIVTAYSAIAAAVRTIHPQYRMTFAQFIGMFGYSLLAGFFTMLAALLFIIPAYWVGVKLMLMPYTYVVTNGAPDTLKNTWNMTTGYYWKTFGMFLLLGICESGILLGAYLVAFFIGSLAPISAVVLAPLVLAALAWLLHVQALAYVRWTDALLPRANLPARGAPVPA
ncbi:MAG TPA: hypothetical protein VJP85_00385 [Candidatus Baltobacteraceae bacterium]|nr:hypothetical protein [Candidatus Baltobacteraceae bacterium]